MIPAITPVDNPSLDSIGSRGINLKSKTVVTGKLHSLTKGKVSFMSKDMGNFPKETGKPDFKK